MVNEKLTLKQEAFVQALIEGKSQREAYKAAGYKTDVITDAAIDVAACKLLKKPKVALRYEELHGKVIDEGEKRAVATAVEVLEELSHIAMGSKTFPAYDMFGVEHQNKPSVPVRLKALELLGKKYGMFTDKVEIKQPEPIKIEVDYGDG